MTETFRLVFISLRVALIVALVLGALIAISYGQWRDRNQ